MEVLIEVIGGLLELWLGDLDLPDTRASRIYLGAIIIFLGGLIWWELI